MSNRPKTPKDLAQPGLVLRLIIYFLDMLKQFLSNTALNGLKYLVFKYLIFWEKYVDDNTDFVNIHRKKTSVFDLIQ